MELFTESLEIPCFDRPGLKIKVKELLYISRSAYQEIAVYDTKTYGRCLFLDGVIQSAESDHGKYDKTILKKLKPTDRNLLILGGGEIPVPFATIGTGFKNKIGISEAVGYSDTMSFDEALNDALKNPPPDSGEYPDQLKSYTITSISAEFGGFAGVKRLRVAIRGTSGGL